MKMSKKKKAVKRELPLGAIASQQLVKTSIGIGFEVWKCAKIRALETGLTLAEIVETALRKFLEKEME